MSMSIEPHRAPQPPSSTTHTPTQDALLDIWRQILWVPDIGLHDNFIDLGGHSLTATRCINRIRLVFGVEVPLDAFFVEEADVATIAGMIDATRATTGTGA